MVNGFRVEAFHPTDFVCFFGEMRQQVFVHPHAAFAHLAEVILRRSNGKAFLFAGHRGESLPVSNGFGQFFVVPVFHAGFIVEQIDLRWTTDHMQIDDSFGLW